MPRARAEKLLVGVLARAAAYNADDAKPFIITEIVVFGSYLQPDVTELGDLDLVIRFAERRDGSTSSEALLAYSRASGRHFPHLLARLGWAETEILLLLRNRSGYINVHTEDISNVTNEWEVAYLYPVTGPGER